MSTNRIAFMIALTAALPLACVDARPYRCAADQQCGAGGMCSPLGCSFADPSCASGRRYGELTGAPDQCVQAQPPEPDPDGGSAPDGGADGSSEPGASIDSLGAGGQHSCLLTSAGQVACWGRNDLGQLGDGTRRRRGTPAPIAGLPPIAELAVGSWHTCARTRAGEVYCWGSDYYGQQPDHEGEYLTPARVIGLGDVIDLDSGANTTCAVTRAGAVWCWGENGDGQLGDGTSGRSATRVQVIDLPPARKVALGWNFACALPADTAQPVWCWGKNDYGQLGRTAVETGFATPMATTILGATELDAGRVHACVMIGGAPRCWGGNSYGELGAGPVGASSPTPQQVRNVTGVLALSTQAAHTCARVARELWCWGNDYDGQVGLGSAASGRDLPARVNGLPAGQLRSVATGDGHTCALIDDAVSCWGHNAFGQLGDGMRAESTAPLKVLDGVLAVTVGDNHACVRRSGGAVQCWGRGNRGQIGDGMDLARTSPVDVPLAAGALHISAGSGTTCAVTAAHGGMCWGYDDAGAVGNGGAPASALPVDVSGLTGAEEIVLGGWHACARKGTGAVLCWGGNADGQLGASGPNQPAPVAGPVTDAAALTGGMSFACARTAVGGVRCWGENNYGQLGDGSYLPRSGPITVVKTDSQPLTGVVELVSGWYHSCARVGVQVYCWGNNGYGQVGDGDGSAHLAATPVAGLAATRLAAGGSTTCALTMAGKVACWGDNSRGQAGDPTPGRVAIDRPTVIAGSDLDGTVDLAVGTSSACARRSDASLWCWGGSEFGELGLGGELRRLAPVGVQLP